MFQSQLVKFLRCPITWSPLALVSPAQLSLLNECIDSRRLVTRLHQIQDQALEGALVNEDQSWVFPIHDEIPNLNPDTALNLKGLALEPANPDDDRDQSPVKE